MRKRGGATRGGSGGGGGRKKARVEEGEVERLRASIAQQAIVIAQKDAVVAQQAAALAQQAAALAQKDAVIAKKDAVIAQKDAVIAQQAAAIDELVPHPPSDVWAESHFAEHATLHWMPRATGAVASELVIGAIDDATRERLDDLGCATSDAIGACVVDSLRPNEQ